MTTSLPRWVHRDPPRAASPDSWWSLRSARVPPVHYLDKLLQLSLGATPLNLGVQVLMAERVRRTNPLAREGSAAQGRHILSGDAR